MPPHCLHPCLLPQDLRTLLCLLQENLPHCLWHISGAFQSQTNQLMNLSYFPQPLVTVAFSPLFMHDTALKSQAPLLPPSTQPTSPWLHYWQFTQNPLKSMPIPFLQSKPPHPTKENMANFRASHASNWQWLACIGDGPPNGSRQWRREGDPSVCFFFPSQTPSHGLWKVMQHDTGLLSNPDSSVFVAKKISFDCKLNWKAQIILCNNPVPYIGQVGSFGHPE